MFTHLLEDQSFASSINVINFDEAHFIVTSGEPDKENKIFRVEYSKCYEIRLRLPLKTPCTVFSATMPSKIQDRILESLKLPTDPSETSFISLTTNRQNLSFAVRKLTRPMTDMSNLDFLVPKSKSYHPPMAVYKKTLIFVSTSTSARNVENYLGPRLPGMVKRIYALMSTEYKKQTIADFIDPNGSTRVLISTSLLSNVSPHPLLIICFIILICYPGFRSFQCRACGVVRSTYKHA